MEWEGFLRGKKMRKKIIRCAIYTRKSTEEGLEQDFNSLDAQREACEAYIKSQQHEGWVLQDKQYNDGGFSGGNLERPALKELFKDIESGKIDTVIVYKIDRLTRSLMDFSKIVDVFDKQSVTFVSITQQFNTTTSMGRLTLNILLSFAQFEREVTGERIRDKVAASKKKGMWMGGNIPTGYKLENKKLVPDALYTQTINTIFDKYLETGSVLRVKTYLDEHTITTRSGKKFSKGNIAKILKNKVYIGKISHKGAIYDGEHKGIVDVELFNKVQEAFEENKILTKARTKEHNTSYLAGKIFDDRGNRMNPSHSNTKNKRYRYYVSQAIIQWDKKNVGSVSKVPASQIEDRVKEEVEKLIKDRTIMQEHISDFDVSIQRHILTNLLKQVVTRGYVQNILQKVILYSDKIDISIDKAKLLEDYVDIDKNHENNTIQIVKNMAMVTTSRGGALVINGTESKSNVNPFLVKLITKSYYWNKLIDEGIAKNSKDIQKMENLTDNSYILSVLKLRFLSPRITEAILEGRQPIELTVQKLLKVQSPDWKEQEKFLIGQQSRNEYWL